jgi:dGTPase
MSASLILLPFCNFNGLKMDADAIEFAKEKELLAEKLNQREHEENSTRSGSDDRSSYSRDYARVLYSSSFRRLQGKMQLLGIDETRFTRNRLTHSLEVAQIARGLATSLKLKETIVSETCALIHDIGNPPFGHAGECQGCCRPTHAAF